MDNSLLELAFFASVVGAVVCAFALFLVKRRARMLPAAAGQASSPSPQPLTPSPRPQASGTQHSMPGAGSTPPQQPPASPPTPPNQPPSGNQPHPSSYDEAEEVDSDPRAWYYPLFGSVAALGLFATLVGAYVWGFIFLLLTTFGVVFGLRNIPNKPAHVGLLTFWGRRLRIVLREGYKLVADFFPFFIGIVTINVEKKNTDFNYQNIPCRLKKSDEKEVDEQKEGRQAGGFVSVSVSITWEPNQERASHLIRYINAAEIGGVEKIVRDPLGEIIRQIAANQDWERFMFGKERLSAVLLTYLTGERVRRVRRDENGLPTVIDPRRYEYVEGRDYLEEEILSETVAPPGSREERLMLSDINHHMQVAMSNGITDVHDLGILIRRLNVTNIQPEGDLKKDAEAATREIQHKRKQALEQAARLEVAQQMVRASAPAEGQAPTLTLGDAFTILRIDEGKASESITRVVLEGKIGEAAEAIKSLAPLAPQLGALADRLSRAGKSKGGKGGKK